MEKNERKITLTNDDDHKERIEKVSLSSSSTQSEHISNPKSSFVWCSDWSWHNLSNKIVNFKGNSEKFTLVP
jgi:hypothetical protein